MCPIILFAGASSVLIFYLLYRRQGHAAIVFIMKLNSFRDFVGVLIKYICYIYNYLKFLLVLIFSVKRLRGFFVKHMGPYTFHVRSLF